MKSYPFSLGFLVVAMACAPATTIEGGPTTATPTLSAESTNTVEAEPVELSIGGSSAVLPRGLTSFGAATDGTALYVSGGYFGKPHAYSEAGQSDELLRLDLASGRWERFGGNVKAQSIALVEHEGTLIRIGGMQARNADGTPADLHSLDSVQAFDPATRTWSSLPPLPAPRSSHDAIVIGNTLWVVGGWSLQGEQSTWHKTAALLDLSNPDAGWDEIDAPFERRALAAATADGKLVVMGGIDSARRLSTDVDVYDPSTKQWTRGPEYPGPGFGVAAASLGTDVFASGMDGIVHRWQPGQPQWTRVTTLAFPRFFHRLVPSNDGDLLVLGGIRDMGSGTRVRPIERISTTPGSGPSILAFSVPSPLPTKNRQGIAVDGDSVYLFGGNVSLGQHDFEPQHFSDVGGRLDLTSMQWHEIAPYPAKRQTMSTFVTDWGQIVSVGGFGHDGEVARTHPEVFAYHPGKNEWHAVGQLPGQGRTQFGLSVQGKDLTVLGGLDYDPRRSKEDQFRHETGLLHADLSPTNVSFESAPLELRQARRAFATATIDTTVYLVGGMKEGFALVDTCESFDTASGAWSDIACPSRTRLSGQMVALNGKLYLTGGSSRESADSRLNGDPSLEMYDPATDRWTTVADALPIEPRHLTMRTLRDRLLLVSTHNTDQQAHVLLIRP